MNTEPRMPVVELEELLDEIIIGGKTYPAVPESGVVEIAMKNPKRQSRVGIGPFTDTVGGVQVVRDKDKFVITRAKERMDLSRELDRKKYALLRVHPFANPGKEQKVRVVDYESQAEADVENYSYVAEAITKIEAMTPEMMRDTAIVLQLPVKGMSDKVVKANLLKSATNHAKAKPGMELSDPGFLDVVNHPEFPLYVVLYRLMRANFVKFVGSAYKFYSPDQPLPETMGVTIEQAIAWMKQDDHRLISLQRMVGKGGVQKEKAIQKKQTPRRQTKKAE